MSEGIEFQTLRYSADQNDIKPVFPDPPLPIMTVTHRGVVSFNSDLSPAEGAEQAWALLLEMVEQHNCGVAALQAENQRLREALEPFSIFAGVLFSQNFHRDDAVATIKGKHGEATLIFEAFLDARAALKQET